MKVLQLLLFAALSSPQSPYSSNKYYDYGGNKFSLLQTLSSFPQLYIKMITLLKEIPSIEINSQLKLDVIRGLQDLKSISVHRHLHHPHMSFHTPQIGHLCMHSSLYQKVYAVFLVEGFWVFGFLWWRCWWSTKRSSSLASISISISASVVAVLVNRGGGGCKDGVTVYIIFSTDSLLNTILKRFYPQNGRGWKAGTTKRVRTGASVYIQMTLKNQKCLNLLYVHFALSERIPFLK